MPHLNVTVKVLQNHDGSDTENPVKGLDIGIISMYFSVLTLPDPHRNTEIQIR